LRPYLENTHHKKRAVEWLRVYGLNSNPSTGKENLFWQQLKGLRKRKKIYVKAQFD
jgi:hypothetical protein